MKELSHRSETAVVVYRDWNNEHVIGIIGNTRKDTIEYLFEAMPKLAKYPPSALIFRLKAQTMGANFDYSDITDQAWEGLAAGQLNQDIMQIRIVLDKQKVAEIEKKLNPVQAVESTGLSLPASIYPATERFLAVIGLLAILFLCYGIFFGRNGRSPPPPPAAFLKSSSGDTPSTRPSVVK